jgi:hypothetical protein
VGLKYAYEINYALQWKATLVVLVYLSHVPSNDKRYSTAGRNHFILLRINWLLIVFIEVLHMAVLCCGSIIFSMLTCVLSLISYPRQNSHSFFYCMFAARMFVWPWHVRQTELFVTHSLKGVRT